LLIAMHACDRNSRFGNRDCHLSHHIRLNKKGAESKFVKRAAVQEKIHSNQDGEENQEIYRGAAGDPRPAVTASRLLALRANRHSAVPGLTPVG